jgi:hypothetical protein
MNLEIRTEAQIFLSWEYLFQIFGILSLQCGFYKFSQSRDLLLEVVMKNPRCFDIEFFVFLDYRPCLFY